jgi:tetratricopeptide (TPR) repeat protein
MKLQLRYQAKPVHPIWSAYLPGNPVDWFAELAHWPVNHLLIKAYLVPESIAKNNCGGLFVVFGAAIEQSNQIRYPFVQITDGFFIPLNAKLFPELLNEELSAVKLWDVQFFHPNIGLVGFENKDAHRLSDLIETPKVVNGNWLSNLPSGPVLPQLRSIMIEPLEPTDAIDDLKTLINTQDLSDIPKTEEESGQKAGKWNRILKPLSILALWIILFFALIGRFILQIIAYLFPKQAASIGNVPKSGFLQQLDAWINKKMASIEKQRDSELNRLVKLFDHDKDAALQYAIPLNSAYLSRGTAAPSGKLSRRSLNLNLRGFGSGAAADVWDLGNYRWELQQRYEKTASQAIAAGDYKKAAYVYAHLLGDLNRAARTLQDGKHFREAAAIYKDHLNNKNLAAGCLEEGGLLNEAIVLYVDLGNYEKAGDLYVRMGQQKQALKYFEDVVQQSLNASDYLKAFNIIAIKIDDWERSKQVLLDGWKNNCQAELCLRQYFDSTVEDGIPLGETVKTIYAAEVSRGKSTSFLRVLAGMTENSVNENFKETALNICYEIVSQQAATGDFSALKMMDRFIPHDPLIVQDTNRYAIQHYREIKHQEADRYIQLDQTIAWVDFCNFHDQLIGIGIKDSSVRLLRMNWDSQMDYLLLFKTGNEAACNLIADAGISNNILITGEGTPGHYRRLLKGHHFDREIDLHQLNWVNPDRVIAINQGDQNTLSAIRMHMDELRLETYSIKGAYQKAVVCTWKGEQVFTSQFFPSQGKMYWRKEHLYFISSNALIRTNETGILETLFVGSSIFNFSISGLHAALKIALLTFDGCLIVSPLLKEMVVSMPLFAEDLGAHCVQVLPDNYLVIANKEKAQVYDIGGKKPRLLFEVIAEHEIARIFTIPKRHYFGLLEADNRISVHVIPQDE